MAIILIVNCKGNGWYWCGMQKYIIINSLPHFHLILLSPFKLLWTFLNYIFSIGYGACFEKNIWW